MWQKHKQQIMDSIIHHEIKIIINDKNWYFNKNLREKSRE